MRDDLSFYADCLIVLYAVGHALGMIAAFLIWLKTTF